MFLLEQLNADIKRTFFLIHLRIQKRDLKRDIKKGFKDICFSSNNLKVQLDTFLQSEHMVINNDSPQVYLGLLI